MALNVIEVDEQFIKDMEQYRQPDKSVGLIEACSKSPIVFAEYMLGIRLYAWQVYYLTNIMDLYNQGKREFVALTSRQIGKSTCISVFSLWAAVFNQFQGTIHNNTIIGITSASDVQAKKLLYEMKKLIRIGDIHMRDKYRDNEDKPMFGKEFFSSLLSDTDANNKTVITFKTYDKVTHGDFILKGCRNGSMIVSYPPTSSVLGETFTIVMIDEAGLTEKISDQFFYDYIYPTGNTTNALRLYTSTPWVCSGFFYRMVDPDEIYNESPAEVVVFTIEAIKIENPNYYETILKTIKQLESDGKHDEVQRAYYCRFVKGETVYFDPAQVIDVFNNNYVALSSYKGLCDMGIDFGGQVKSKTVITITELTKEGKIRRLYHKSYSVGKDQTLIEDIAELKSKFNVQRLIPDDCPAGQFFISAMKEKGWDVHPMSFRAEKVSKYGAFRSKLVKGLIESYQDEELKVEMLAMEYSKGSKQSIIQHAPGYSDDLIDSFVMSTYFYIDDDTGFKAFDFDDIDANNASNANCPKCGSSDRILMNDKIKCKKCDNVWKNVEADIW